MDTDDARIIRKILFGLPKVTTFNVEDNGQIRLVVRYKEEVNNVDIKKLINDGEEAYKNKNYKKCIECYSILLKVGTPKECVYTKIGLSYFKLGQLEKGLDYIIIANSMLKRDNSSWEYDDLINDVRNTLEERKLNKLEKKYTK